MGALSASKVVPSSHSVLSNSVSMNLLLASLFAPTILGVVRNNQTSSCGYSGYFSVMRSYTWPE